MSGAELELPGNAIERVAEAGLLNVETGELLPATIENAGAALTAARTMKERADDIIREITAWLRDESARQGTKTFRAGDRIVTVKGGPTIDYDVDDLREALRAADCPEERIDAAIKEEIVTNYKIDRAVLRQLAAANPDYKAAIELAQREVEKSYSASVTLKQPKG